jgi:hypothetical protein
VDAARSWRVIANRLAKIPLDCMPSQGQAFQPMKLLCYASRTVPSMPALFMPY